MLIVGFDEITEYKKNEMLKCSLFPYANHMNDHWCSRGDRFCVTQRLNDNKILNVNFNKNWQGYFRCLFPVTMSMPFSINYFSSRFCAIRLNKKNYLIPCQQYSFNTVKRLHENCIVYLERKISLSCRFITRQKCVRKIDFVLLAN